MDMKNIYIIIVSLFSLLSITSCEDMLNQEPLDKIGNDSYWKKATDLENYVMQFYTVFPTFGTPGATGIFIADASYGSDDAFLSSVNTTLNGSRSIVNAAKNTNWAWEKIRSVNLFFDNYSRCGDDYKLWSSYLGEAHFFRAWLYFEKVKAYGDVPWYNTALTMESEDLYKARDSRTLVIDSILKDLDHAVELLKPIGEAKGGTNRLSKEVALAFKSRIALFEGSWQKYHAGTDFATEGVDPKKYFRIAVESAEDLMSNYPSVGIYGSNIDDYGDLFGTDDMSDNKEVLLWKQYNKSLNLSHDAQVYHTSRTNGRSATLEFVESFLSRTGEPFDYYALSKTKKGTSFLEHIGGNSDPRLRKTIWIPGDVMWDNNNGSKVFTLPYIGQTSESLNLTGFQLRKGVNIASSGAGGTFGGDSETGAIVFRFAEVLLNYAEAKYELDGYVDYNKSINILRKRVGMPNFKVVNDSNKKRFSDYGYEISDELFEIRRERRVELGAEGFRNIDYKRWRAHSLFQGKFPKGYPIAVEEFSDGTKIPAIDKNGMLDPFKQKLSGGYQFQENRDYLECIPTNEITLNPNLKKNPNW